MREGKASELMSVSDTLSTLFFAIIPKWKVEGVFQVFTCEVKYWTQVPFGYHIEDDRVTCVNNGEASAAPSILNDKIATLEGYDGEILSLRCVLCTEIFLVILLRMDLRPFL